MLTKGAVTKADVAALANVSHMTVTRVLSGSDLVRDETRERVLRACKALGYTPNLVARSLASKRSNILGILVTTIHHSYFSRIMSEVERRASLRGFHVLVAQTNATGPTDRDSVAALLGRRVDGLMAIEQSFEPGVADYLDESQIPVLYVGFPPEEGKAAPYIGMDHLNGARQAVSHLISLGHRRIAHLAGRADSYTALQRCMGYVAAMRANGLQVSESDDVFYTNYQMDGGYVAAENMLRSGTDYTAAFCANDYIAVGALGCLQDHGLRVPEDISLVGFVGDDISTFIRPALTTVVQPAEELGRQAAECLIDIIEGRPFHDYTILDCSLVVRDSTASVVSDRVRGL